MKLCGNKLHYGPMLHEENRTYSKPELFRGQFMPLFMFDAFRPAALQFKSVFCDGIGMNDIGENGIYLAMDRKEPF